MPDVTSWPWPRLIQTDYRTFGLFVVNTGNLYLMEMYLDGGVWVTVPTQDLGDPAIVEQVDVADFGPFYVVSTVGYDSVSDRVIQTFYRDLTISSMTVLTQPAFATCCNFRGQCIGGNVYSPSAVSANYWLSLGTNGVVWSGVGNFDFDPSNDKTAGFMEAFLPNTSLNRGIVYKVLPLGDGIIVYGDSGKVLLRPGMSGGTFSWGTTPLPGLGIASGNHVAGNDSVHGFIDTNRDFWLAEPGPKFTKLGYREFLDAILDYTHATDDYRTIVSYLPIDQRFYVSNGDSCLVINQFGAYTTHQLPSAILFASDGSLYGTFMNGTDTTARVVTDSLDYGSRDIKSLESVVGGGRYGIGGTMRCGVDWRISSNGAFTRSALRNVNPSGEAYIQVAGVEFRLVVEITNPSGVEMPYLLANVKFSDRKFRRGLAPGATRGDRLVTL